MTEADTELRTLFPIHVDFVDFNLACVKFDTGKGALMVTRCQPCQPQNLACQSVMWRKAQRYSGTEKCE
jgi:hypothetical protein